MKLTALAITNGVIDSDDDCGDNDNYYNGDHDNDAVYDDREDLPPHPNFFFF